MIILFWPNWVNCGVKISQIKWLGGCSPSKACTKVDVKVETLAVVVRFPNPLPFPVRRGPCLCCRSWCCCCCWACRSANWPSFYVSRFCMVLNGIVWHICLVCGIFVVLHSIAWHWTVLYGITVELLKLSFNAELYFVDRGNMDHKESEHENLHLFIFLCLCGLEHFIQVNVCTCVLLLLGKPIFKHRKNCESALTPGIQSIPGIPGIPGLWNLAEIVKFFQPPSVWSGRAWIHNN